MILLGEAANLFGPFIRPWGGRTSKTYFKIERICTVWDDNFLRKYLVSPKKLLAFDGDDERC